MLKKPAKFKAKKSSKVSETIINTGDADCIEEFKAFARGGLSSTNLLNRIWPNILKEYNVEEKQIDRLLHKAGLYIRMGKIKSFEYVEDPESP
jgi:hypothetical protein